MVSPFGGMGSGAEDSLNFGHTEGHSGSTRHAQWCFLNWRSVDYISLRQLQHAFSYYKLSKVPQKCKVFGFSPASLVPEFLSLVYMLGKASRAFNYLQLTWKEFEFHKRTTRFTSDWSWSRSWQPCPHLKFALYSLWGEMPNVWWQFLYLRIWGSLWGRITWDNRACFYRSNIPNTDLYYTTNEKRTSQYLRTRVKTQ